MKSKEIIIIIIVIILTVLINLSGILDAFSESIYNYYFYLNKESKVSQEIVLVNIDTKTIKKAGSWPLKREGYAKVLNKIIESRPAVIGIVIAFSDKTNATEDELLYKTLKSFDNIVLIAKYKKETVQNFIIQTPEKSVFPEIKQGHTLINYSKTNTVIGFEPNKVYQAFALQVSNLFFKATNNPLNPLLDRYKLDQDHNRYSTSDVVWVDYKRTPEYFKSVSFIDVLNNNFDKSLFKDKIVLIGITDRYNTTSFSTPYTSINKVSSTALELQAQFIDSIINYRGFTTIDNTYVYILSILIALIFYFFTRKSRILLQGIYILMAISLVIIVNYMCFSIFAVWFNIVLPLSMLISIFAAYIYFTSFNIDKNVRDSLESLKGIDILNLKEIPDNVNSKVETLTSLIKIINQDRQTIKVIMEGINNALIVFNAEGKIVWFNSHLQEYFPENTLENKNIEETIENLKLQDVTEKINKEGFYKNEHPIKTRDFICYINQIDSETTEYLAILNDVTELKEMDRLKTDMVRMVSHELKNPLTGIQLCAENILDVDSREFTIENAESIYKTTELLRDTISNFLNLSRLENNMMEFKPEKIDIYEIINQSIELQSGIASSKAVKINLNSTDSAYVMVDSKQLLIVINNLIANAIKYSLRDSEINVIVNTNNSNVIVSVKDTGIGIPEDEIEFIFDKFFRSRNNKENNIEGTGLGLAIIKTIVEKHNGKIWVESKENEGSVFSFSLKTAPRF